MKSILTAAMATAAADLALSTGPKAREIDARFTLPESHVVGIVAFGGLFTRLCQALGISTSDGLWLARSALEAAPTTAPN